MKFSNLYIEIASQVKPILFFSALLCFASSVQSQVPEAARHKLEMPSGPLLRPPADFSRWEISFSYPDEQKKKDKTFRKTKLSTEAANARPRKIVTTKTGRIVHEESIDILHRATDTWFDAGSQYMKPSGDSHWYRVDKAAGSNTSVDTNNHPLPAIGYRDVDMIKEENYVGTISYEQRHCLVFVPGDKAFDLTKADTAQKKLNAVDTVAYIDADTRLPVELRIGGELRTFQFGPPPTEMQTLPFDLTTQKTNSDDARERLNQTAPRPY